MSGGESKEEQLDRELIELLNELRVALPGVQCCSRSSSGCRSPSVSDRTVFVGADMLFEKTSAAIVAAVTAAFFAWLWYGAPLLRRWRLDR